MRSIHSCIFSDFINHNLYEVSSEGTVSDNYYSVGMSSLLRKRGNHIHHMYYIQCTKCDGGRSRINFIPMIIIIGPASNSVETLVKLIENGMCVARMNFSHGDHEVNYILVC